MLIDSLFRFQSGNFAIQGIAVLFFPIIFVYLGYNEKVINSWFSNDFNEWLSVPALAGHLFSLCTILGYAATFPSAHDKAKVARGLLFFMIGGAQFLIRDLLDDGQTEAFKDNMTAYINVVIAAIFTIWTFIECFSATVDDANPIKKGAKKDNHQSTGNAVNNFYLRALSLLWLFEGCIVWFAPTQVSKMGINSLTLASTLRLTLSSLWTPLIGSAFIAQATIAGYAATFQAVHDQAKVARGFWLYWLVSLGYAGYAVVKGINPAFDDDRVWYVHVAISLLFFIGSNVVSFSSYADDAKNPAVKDPRKTH